MTWKDEDPSEGLMDMWSVPRVVFKVNSSWWEPVVPIGKQLSELSGFSNNSRSEIGQVCP